MDIHFVDSGTLKTVLQADMAMKASGFTFPWGRSAALSTTDPNRKVIGHWKNRACLLVEEAMRQAYSG